MAKDPVCNMEVNEKNAGYRSTYMGKEYNFCSADCKSEFDKNPMKYVG